MTSQYLKHLNSLNTEDIEDMKDTETIEHKSEDKKFAICPIVLNEIDALNKASTISIIRNSRDANEIETNELKKIYPEPLTGKFQIHIADVFDLEAAYKWFYVMKQNHPASRKDIGDVARNRIATRYEFRRYLNEIYSRDVLINLFKQYLIAIINGTNSELMYVAVLLCCHLEPEMLPNFFNVDRQQAEEMVSENKEKGYGPTWIVRPSKFKGYSFAKMSNGQFYPMSEFYVVTWIDETTGSFSHDLFEKVFSCGYYTGKGSYVGESLNYDRAMGYPCFMDLLCALLSAYNTNKKFNILSINSINNETDSIECIESTERVVNAYVDLENENDNHKECDDKYDV